MESTNGGCFEETHVLRAIPRSKEPGVREGRPKIIALVENCAPDNDPENVLSLPVSVENEW